MTTVKTKNGREYIFDGEFHVATPNEPIRNENNKLVGVTNPRTMTYVHSYGGEATFFNGLSEGKLYGTQCENPDCKDGYKTIFLPFRIHCPDCLEKATPIDLTDLARQTATLHTFMTTMRTGAFNTLDKPIKFINVEFEGVSTILMSYLSVGDPQIGLRVVPIFRTKNPTYTITDLSFVTEGTPEKLLPDGFSY